MSKAIQEYKMSKEYKSQSQKVFDTLEEGIVVITDGSVSFMNNVFKQILEPFNQQNKEAQDIKMFKISKAGNVKGIEEGNEEERDEK